MSPTSSGSIDSAISMSAIPAINPPSFPRIKLHTAVLAFSSSLRIRPSILIRELSISLSRIVPKVSADRVPSLPSIDPGRVPIAETSITSSSPDNRLAPSAIFRPTPPGVNCTAPGTVVCKIEPVVGLACAVTSIAVEPNINTFGRGKSWATARLGMFAGFGFDFGVLGMTGATS